MKQIFIFKYFDKYFRLADLFLFFFSNSFVEENEQKSHVCVRKTYNTVHKHSNNRLKTNQKIEMRLKVGLSALSFKV